MNKPRDIIFHPIHFLSLGLGSGLAPFAPGTVGTLLAVLLYFPLALLPLTSYIAVLIVGSLIGIYLCAKTSNKLVLHDHSAIFCDEFLNFL